MSGAPEIFTLAWARAFCQALDANARYRRVARTWEGALVLVMEADPDHGIPTPRAVHLDLAQGHCHAAWAGVPEQAPPAAYRLRATPRVWKAILTGDLPPIAALLRGQLHLEQGNTLALLPYVRAAQELVATAARLPTTFPPGW